MTILGVGSMWNWEFMNTMSSDFLGCVMLMTVCVSAPSDVYEMPLWLWPCSRQSNPLQGSWPLVPQWWNPASFSTKMTPTGGRWVKVTGIGTISNKIKILNHIDLATFPTANNWASTKGKVRLGAQGKCVCGLSFLKPHCGPLCAAGVSPGGQQRRSDS